MAREIAVTAYLFIYKVLFAFFSRFSLEDKTVFVVSFGDNAQAIITELKRRSPTHKIIAVLSGENSLSLNAAPEDITTLNQANPLHFFQFIHHLATAKYVFVDNYFGFLAAIRFRTEVTCVQLWHTAGAIKRFGLEDLSNSFRSPRAISRLKRVYNTFNHVVVGSDEMISVFMRSFGLSEDRFIKTGIPRSDYFFDDDNMQADKGRLLLDYPNLNNKQALLYAPTYRDNKLHMNELALDLDKMYEHFKEDYVLFLRLHPAIKSSVENKYPGFIYDISTATNLNKYLVVTDLLITDYSSIPFEFSLLHRPMIFYAYDLEIYAKTRGLWDKYEQRVPGPVVKTTDELIRVIEEGTWDAETVRRFAEQWNKYSVGKASENVVREIYDFD